MKNLIENTQKYFLKFAIVGGLNTVIHLVIYNIALTVLTIVLSQMIAFILASVFSYFANVKFTYNKKAEVTTFTLAMIIFGFKLGLNALLAFGFQELLIVLLLTNFNSIIPIFITICLLPLQFLLFNVLFGVNKKEKVIQYE